MHTLVLVGELDRSSTAILEAAIEALYERRVDAIALDLTYLTRIDAVGIAVIELRAGWCARRGISLVLAPGPPSVQLAFARDGALERLTFDDAVASRERASELEHVQPTAPARLLIVGA